MEERETVIHGDGSEHKVVMLKNTTFAIVSSLYTVLVSVVVLVHLFILYLYGPHYLHFIF
jgi:hypothetical protein